MPPRALPLNHLRLEEADDRFGHRIVIGIAATTDGRRDAGLGEARGVAHRQILRAAIAMMHEVLDAGAASVVDRLLEGIEDEVRRQRSRDAPPYDAPRKDVN